MPQKYEQADEGTTHVTLRNFPDDLIEELDAVRAYHETPRRTMILRLLREALEARKQTEATS
jgi:metal-responsive CopG/Arc/MetJ family transcriptional regulator|tara:strand:+ start:837 stop:1022 length:186 start_codon:yes stop_codon:yes gene_type:complete